MSKKNYRVFAKSISHRIKEFANRLKTSEILPLAYGIDRWYRHKIISGEVKGCNTVLNVGSGSFGIPPEFYLPRHADIVLLDLRAPKSRTKDMFIVADMCYLPLRDDLFEAVISIDAIEHIPRKSRFLALKEMLRVAKDIVAVHSPLDYPPAFLGRKYDLLFLKVHKRIFGHFDRDTLEHVIAGHPTFEELLNVFPESKITGSQNCHIWLLTMTLQSTIIFRPLAWILYVFVLKRLANREPFHACKLIYHKTARA